MSKVRTIAPPPALRRDADRDDQDPFDTITQLCGAPGAPPPADPDLIAFVEALARAHAARDIARAREATAEVR